jgi:hypothetical protein
MNDRGRADPQERKHSFLPVVGIHAILTVFLFVALIWLVPTFLLQFEDLFGRLPRSVVLLADVSNFFARIGMFLLPVAAILVWLDARICQLLQVRCGQGFVDLWSVVVVFALTAALFFIAYAFTTASTDLYQFHQQQVQESKE